MAVQYYFDNLEPTAFQRLINALLVARYGDIVRLLPLRGRDGGRDAETAPETSLFEVIVDKRQLLGVDRRLGPGRYIFQSKYHRTTDQQGTVVRSAVLSDFENEINTNVLHRDGERVNYFFLITNVPSSKES